MQYSVWDWNQRKYDVFESSIGEQPGQRPAARRKGPGPTGPGQQIESLMPILPTDAVLVEHSDTAKGRVAIHHTSPAVKAFGGFGATTPSESPLVKHPWLVLGLGAAAVSISYRLLIAIARHF